MRIFAKDKNQEKPEGFIVIIIFLIVGILIFAGSAAFSAGISGQFQGVNGESGGDGSGGIADAGDNCHLETTLDVSTATKTTVDATVTGYYSPRPGQAKYSKGNYADEKEMNAPKDPKTASGIDVAKGAVVVDDSKYPFGTVFEIPGYGRGIAVDTGGKVNGTHLDLWSGIGDAGLDNALRIGNKPALITVYTWPGVDKAQLRSSIKRVCGAAMASAGKGCPAIAGRAASITSTLSMGRRTPSTSWLFNQRPGGTGPSGKCWYSTCDIYWCTYLVMDSYRDSGFKIPPTLASAAGMASWFNHNEIYIPNGSGKAQAGDMIDFKQGGGSGHHVGIVGPIDGDCFKTYEANSGSISHTYCLIDGLYKGNGLKLLGFGRIKNCQ